ncbi:MAG: hypothetical protein JSR58_07935 [Verrucomicrobia bacterium]|nr:hypothetical protein [Verrucomicrobiota bacterium]
MRIIKLALFLVCFFSIARFVRGQTDGFTWAKVRSELPFHPEWAVDSSVPQIFDQKFHYLGKGAQSFVFASQDGKYVLKFFRHHHMRAPWIIRSLPFAWAQAKAQKKESKLKKDFLSYTIAFREMPEETGIIYLHLNKTDHLKKKVTFVDKLGTFHEVDLDGMEFMVQKRATLLYPSIAQLMEKGETEKAKGAIADLLELLQKRMRKGIFDKDPDLNTNFGYVGGKPIQIDVGRFRYDRDRPFSKDEIIRITDHFHQWLMIQYPVLDDYLRERLNEI